METFGHEKLERTLIHMNGEKARSICTAIEPLMQALREHAGAETLSISVTNREYVTLFLHDGEAVSHGCEIGVYAAFVDAANAEKWSAR